MASDSSSTCKSFIDQINVARAKIDSVRSLTSQLDAEVTAAIARGATAAQLDALLNKKADLNRQLPTDTSAILFNAKNNNCTQATEEAQKLFTQRVNAQNQINVIANKIYAAEDALQAKAADAAKESQKATTSKDNAGTGKPGTAGTGQGATPNSDELNELAVTSKKKPVPVTNDPAYKEAPRGADDFGDVAPGLEATQPKIVADEPNLVGAGTVDVTEPNFNFSEETGADTNQGLQEATDDAQAQATVQDAQNWALQGDWRVRLALAPQSPSILYRADEPGVLAPLKDTDGVIFPYTPNINVTYSANYEPLTLTHTNYKTFQYQSSSIDQIVISCDFTAQDTDEANYILAVIHFFRAATKMFYGQNQSPKTGTPPPLCYLYGFGQLQFNAHPLVIANFNYNLPTDVDYIRATTSPSSPPGVNRSAANARDNSPDISNSRLNSGGQSIAPGGQVPPAQLPQTAAGGTVEPTYVPTKINLQITAYPIVTRYDQSRVFNNKQYNNGQLLLGSQRGLGGGFW